MSLPSPSPAAAPPAGVKPAVWTFIFSLVCVLMTSNAPAPLYPIWKAQMGFSQGVQSSIFAVYNLGVLVALVLFGGLADVFGPRKVLVPALLSVLTANFCFAFASSAGWLELGRFLTGIASGIALSAGVAAVQRNGVRRGMRHPALFASVAAILGVGVGPLMAGVFADFAPLPLQLIFYLLAGVTLVELIVLVRLPAEALPPIPAPADGKRRARLRLPAVPRDGRRLFIAATLTFGGAFGVAALFISLAPNMLAALLEQDSPLVAGATSFLVFGVGGMGQFFVREWSMQSATRLGQGLVAAGLLCVLVAEWQSTLWLFALAALLSGMGLSVSQYSAIQIVESVAPREQLGAVNAGFFLGGYTLGGVAVLVLGFASDWLGLMGGSLLYAGLCFAILFAAAFGMASSRSWTPSTTAG